MSQPEDLQLSDFYTEVTGSLPGTEGMVLDEFLDPRGGDFEIEQPD